MHSLDLQRALREIKLKKICAYDSDLRRDDGSKGAFAGMTEIRDAFVEMTEREQG